MLRWLYFEARGRIRIAITALTRSIIARTGREGSMRARQLNVPSPA
jgi:hypothetical protein